MLRVGLTGGLASGKSSVGLVFAEGGAHVLSADEIGRRLMQPGQPVYEEIVRSFGAAVVRPDGLLDRQALAQAAFAGGRLAELNSIVHPAVLAAQESELARLAEADRGGIAVVESALIFEGSRQAEVEAGASRQRFDRLVLVTAPEGDKIARYVARVVPAEAREAARAEAAAEARRRLAAQLPDSAKIALVDYVIENTSSLVLLRRRAQAVLRELRAVARA